MNPRPILRPLPTADIRTCHVPSGPRPTRFPIVRGSAIDGHGWSAGDARDRMRIMELEVVARVGIEPYG